MIKKAKRNKEALDIFKGFADAIADIPVRDGFSEAIDAILKCHGTIIVTGMGKAGHAMKKFSSLLCSLGFPSVYIHPGESSHGDLGMVTHKDVLFVASTSGKTREVIEMMKQAKENGVSKIIGITSHKDGWIRKDCDIIVEMGNIKEAGHLGLAPTTSILVMLAITDAIALICAKEEGLTKEKYARFHHSGYLGSLARNDKRIL